MSIYNPLGSFDHADPQKMKVTPVFPDKDQPQEIKFKSLTLRSERMIELYCLLLLQTKIEEILEAAKKQFIVSDQDLGDVLQHLKTLFQKLMIIDTSHDYLFAEDLSKHWHILIRIIELLENSKIPPNYLGSLQLFVKTIFEYPKKRDHTLGYYLNEYTGEKWIPFPFMDILSKLHEDALIKKTKSVLHDWVLALSSILSSLK